MIKRGFFNATTVTVFEHTKFLCPKIKWTTMLNAVNGSQSVDTSGCSKAKKNTFSLLSVTQ